MKIMRLLLTSLLGLSLTLGLIWFLGGIPNPVAHASELESPVRSGPAIPETVHDVCDSGCTYPTIQDAVDAASSGDLIKVREGTYDVVHQRAGITQVVYITKSLTLQGGYSTGNWDTPDPENNPTILDAQGLGRGIYITGNITTTVDGFHITNGDAEGLLGGGPDEDAGGGVYIANANANISNCEIYENYADTGGGLGSPNAYLVINANKVYSNTARISDAGGVGGYQISGRYTNNEIYGNKADVGAGLSFIESQGVLIEGNTIFRNDASSNGGGLSVIASEGISVTNNDIISNTAGDFAGGIEVAESFKVILEGNTIQENDAFDGGGLGVDLSELITVTGNTFNSNSSTDHGGGIYLLESISGTISGNLIFSNTAAVGGGLELADDYGISMINNVILDNHADEFSGALFVLHSDVDASHTTIAGNTSGDGSAIFVENLHWEGDVYSWLRLTNTVCISHSVGISVSSGNTATVNGILWDTNTPVTISQGAGAIVSVQNQYTGDPAFASDGYHLTAPSDAIDQGVNSGVSKDIDGEARPVGSGYDLGADEYYQPSIQVNKWASSNTPYSGDTLTYTLWVYNHAVYDLNALITDTLPANVTPTGEKTWSPVIAASGGNWTTQFPVIISDSYTGPLTNVVRVTTIEGASGVFTHTATVIEPPNPALSVTKQADRDSLYSGETLTYTIQVTNTGNLDLHTIITDTLPANATPSGELTWTPLITAPFGVWMETFTVTVDGDFSGTLENVVQVDSSEGASGVFTHTATVTEVPNPALSVSKHADRDMLYSGETLTYTIRVTNTGNLDLHTSITDTLPANVTPSDELTWSPLITEPLGVWTETFTVTVDSGYTGPLANVLHVDSTEGASGVFTHTATVIEAPNPALSVTKSADRDTLYAGEMLTYTILVTNTGNLDLHTTITDTLPANITPTGELTWSPLITAPLGVWKGQFLVRVDANYTGTLINEVEVTSTEGASGSDDHTASVLEAPILGLAAENDGPTDWGAPTWLTATVTQGSNLSFVWDFGDGEMGYGAVVSHTYDFTGTYTAWVTATNSVDQDTTSTVVNVNRSCWVRLNNDSTDYLTVQAAVDASTSESDVVKIAGVCYGVNNTGGYVQQVYIDKTLTLQGGYSTSNWTTPDPDANPTTLDALDKGRVIHVRHVGNPNSFIYGLDITSGNGQNAGIVPYAGGGIYVFGSTVISDCRIFDNEAEYGGGIVIAGGNNVLANSEIYNNIAIAPSSALINGAGGVLLQSGTHSVTNNKIYNNHTNMRGGGLYGFGSEDNVYENNEIYNNSADFQGGGAHLFGDNNLTFSNNTIFGNTTLNYGGGVYYYEQTGLQMIGNQVYSNTSGIDGGGIFGQNATGTGVTLDNNEIFSNTAVEWMGGGLSLWYNDDLVMKNNLVYGNASEYGAGLYLEHSDDSELTNNHFYNNQAGGPGGGIYIKVSDDVTLSANRITENQASYYSSGIYVQGSNRLLIKNNLVLDNHVTYGAGIDVSGGSDATLSHNTIARNTGGAGIGISIGHPYGSANQATLRNNILVSQSVGIHVEANNSADLDGTLWGSGAWANDDDYTSDGSIVTGTVNIWNDPGFINSASSNYHITSTSAARDAGVAASIYADYDGEARPFGPAPDIGFDEIATSQTTAVPGSPSSVQATVGTMTAKVDIPTGAVTETTTIQFTALASIIGESPSGYAFAGLTFDLDAYIGGSLQEGFVFKVPVNITVQYSDADVFGLDENNLKLYYWDGKAWVDAACGAYDYHPADNWFSVPIRHLSQFAVFAPETELQYLPLVFRN